MVPDLIVGEAYTKIRYDRRVSPRRDATIALTVFRLVEETGGLFEVRPARPESYRAAHGILAQYVDQSFSYVDAVVLSIVDGDPKIRELLTVDGSDFSIYRFAHTVEIVIP